MMDECAFCKITKGEIHVHTIWEDEKHLAFLSGKPNTKGFTSTFKSMKDIYHRMTTSQPTKENWKGWQNILEGTYNKLLKPTLTARRFVRAAEFER